MTTAHPVETALEFRVLDLTDESGVYGTKLLADMGADVIRIEPPGGDGTRRRGPFFRGEPHPERSLYSMYMNTNKRGITLNLEAKAGREVFKELVRRTDVVIETFPVGYLASLGLGYEELSRINPNLVMTSVTPFGQTGPYRHWKGSDMVNWALGGALWCSGLPDRPPLNAPDQAYGFSGFNAAIGTLAALLARQSLGSGQHVDISVHESVVNTTGETGVPKYLDDLVPIVRNGSQRPGMTPVGLYPAKDGYISCCSSTPGQWDATAQWIYEVTGDEAALADIYKGGVAQRYVYEEAVIWLVSSLSSQYTKADFFKEGQRRDIPVAPVNTVAELLQDEQLHAREYWVEVDHPETGRITYPGAPYLFSESPWSLRRPAPRIGQHNEEVYVRELGLSKDDLASLLASGVF